MNKIQGTSQRQILIDHSAYWGQNDILKQEPTVFV